MPQDTVCKFKLLVEQEFTMKMVNLMTIQKSKILKDIGDNSPVTGTDEEAKELAEQYWQKFILEEVEKLQ